MKTPQRRGAPTEYEYRWCGDYAAIIDGHTTPEGSGVLATPGENFKTIAPLDHFQAEPQNEAAKAAAPKKEAPEGEQSTDGEGASAPDEKDSA